MISFMTDVTSPSDVNQPVETATTPAPSGAEPNGGTPTQPSTPPGDGTAGAPDATQLQSQIDNLNKALQFERNRNKQLTRGRQTEVPGNPENAELYQNPEYQRLALQNATYALRDGAKDIIARYPQLPPAVAKAINHNPRGWVNEGTSDIDNALLDIEENIINYLQGEGLENATQPGAQPQPVQIAQTNKGTATDKNVEAELDRIKDIPPEEWTPEEEALVDSFLKSQRKSKK